MWRYRLASQNRPAFSRLLEKIRKSYYARTAIGRKHAFIMAPQSCLSLTAANQPATAFGGLTEMVVSARSSLWPLIFRFLQRLRSKFLGVSKHYNSEFAFRVAHSSVLGELGMPVACFLNLVRAHIQCKRAPRKRSQSTSDN